MTIVCFMTSDYDCFGRGIHRSNPDELNSIIRSAIRRSQINDHDPVLVVLDEASKGSDQFHPASIEADSKP